MILDVANFRTLRDERIRLTESSKFQHEFDIIADSPEGTLLVECKQYSGPVPKDMLTKFLGKITDYQNTHPEKRVWGLFVVSEFDMGQYEEYREYMKRNNVTFWDAQDLENIWERYKEVKDSTKFHEILTQLLGMKQMQKEVSEWATRQLRFGKEMSTRRKIAEVAGKATWTGLKLLGKGLLELSKPSTRRKIDRLLFGQPTKRRSKQSKPRTYTRRPSRKN
jgi:hypothetical protein